MNYIINGREPAGLFRFFEDICSIPHGSGNESALADYIVNFARERGIYAYRDGNDNVLLRRRADYGCEGREPILIQGHIDMVCEAESWNDIDFTRDGLELRLDGNMLTANGTTLGADDGVAVAIMLALLDENGGCMPEIECLFTTEEETGLTGASSFDYSRLHSRRMINLDTGGEIVIVSCAGGMRTKLSCRAKTEPYSGKAITVEVDGLAGGHSGADIHLGRANANLCALRLAKAADARIVKLAGGSKDNAIPSRCAMTVTADDVLNAAAVMRAEAESIKLTLNDEDAGMTVNINVVDYDGEAPVAEFTDRLQNLTGELPLGVISMCDGIDMVETSQNYAIIELDPDGAFTLHLSARSSVDEQLDEMKSTLAALAEKYGFDAETGSRYSGWEYAPVSAMRDGYAAVYRELTGRDIEVTGIHAGLECGIIKRAVPDMDIIATGARTLAEHTTREALDLDSLTLVYNAVKLLCSRI